MVWGVWTFAHLVQKFTFGCNFAPQYGQFSSVDFSGGLFFDMAGDNPGFVVRMALHFEGPLCFLFQIR
jgi:hypothetical protein